jgi:hypothetical protein
VYGICVQFLRKKEKPFNKKPLSGLFWDVHAQNTRKKTGHFCGTGHKNEGKWKMTPPFRLSAR